MRTTVGLSAALLALSGLVYACGAGDLSSFGADSTKPSNGESDAGFAGAAAPATGTSDRTAIDNGVILVHAAKSQAFRLCFGSELDRRPQPDSQVMPEANVVGVEVGSAVRLPPLRGAPGRVFLFEEPAIRVFYPTFGGAGAGQSCNDLLTGSETKGLAIELDTITTDLAHGVHLLVVHGCTGDNPLTKFSVAECGPTWTPTKGNLAVKEITLQGAAAQTDGTLPAQVVNLSQPLESARNGRDVVVTFGDLVNPGAPHAAVVTNPLLFGGAQPDQAAQLTYDAKDTAVYESFGFRVSFATSGAPDSGATTVLDESLARIQKQSSPRDVPPSYYAAASNYALLLLGDPDAKIDGGPDTDERRTLHLLAVPVVEPKTDGGTESDGGTTDFDGGTAPTP